MVSNSATKRTCSDSAAKGLSREQDLRPIQIWVPDVRSPAFRSEAHRQSAAIAGSAHAREDQAFIDAVTDWGGK